MADFGQFLTSRQPVVTGVPVAPAPGGFTQFIKQQPTVAPPVTAPLPVTPSPGAASPVSRPALANAIGSLGATAPSVGAQAPFVPGAQRAPVPAVVTPPPPAPPTAALTPSQRFAIYAQQQQALRAGAEAQKAAARAKLAGKSAPYPEQGPKAIPEGIPQGDGVELSRKS